MSDKSSIAKNFVDESNNLLDQAMIKIKNCIDQLSLEQVWWRDQEQLNSIGNLMLHLAGNLRQWSVVGIGGQPDARDRESEFTQREKMSKDELWNRLSSTVDDAKQFFGSLSPESLNESRIIQEFEVTVLGAIVHTTSHFVGHSHQIIYITRQQLGDAYQYQWQPSSDRGSLPI